ncbi:PIR protein [Plasmodium yoelii]|uniref:PIR protein n=2 Tax=Plasmodium yoelii TaxID=5861 RepID=A0AAE9WYN0_PLAYO|nr:PIR protein [Plasmodium yoelii]WBY58969.1 PIR protein [Plasmodium yoelii yoelii]VTZ79801.1 PIR protein [Plasmodium yoelii]|eukprot:XP_022810900.2 PIR protein [Plasmodium yoelii]
MDDKICRKFFSLRTSISDKLDNEKNYKITNEQPIKEYCTNGKCSNNIGKINAGCLFLFDSLFKDSSVFSYYTKNNINFVDYIIIWLSNMLSQIEDKENDSLKFFYTTYINNDKYTNPISGVEDHYSSYKDLIDKKNIMNMDMKIISKLYDAFNTLCMLYIEFDDKSPDCNKYLKYADEFDKKYKKLNKDPSITVNNSYNQLLCTLSTDYDNFKKKYSNVRSCESSPLPTIEKCVQSSELTSSQTFEVASSNSSITNKLFIVLSIFGAIAFFLGISYKYSLFGFQKRFKKQQIREKIKNIKKKMNQ